jgi:hypothetical protein
MKMSPSINTSVVPHLLRARVFGVMAFLAVSGCASGGKPGTKADNMGGASISTAVVRSDASGVASGVNMVAITEVNNTIVMAPPDKVFQALSAAYGTLGIPVTEVNQGSRTIGNAAYRIRRRIGDVPTMRAVDCGGDSSMPNSETYQLTLTIRSRVVPNDAGGSVIQSTVEGSGRNPTTSATSDVRCSSLGALEKRIGELVKKTVAP